MSALGVLAVPAQVIATVLCANRKEASLLHENQQQGANRHYSMCSQDLLQCKDTGAA